jgi:fibro-slime domain-containing protein
MKTWMLLILTVLLGAACEEPPLPADTTNGTGNSGNNNGTDGNPTQQLGPDDCNSLLTAVIRDFPDSHEDFHHVGTDLATPGMVQAFLDADEKPVSASGAMNSTHLDQWYRTIDGVNQEFTYEIQLKEELKDDGTGTGKFVYDENQFFPIDGLGYGNDIAAYPDRNYLFTSELKLSFVYQVGQSFTFRGDDDLWVFINGRLAIDVGGIHSPVEGRVDIDPWSASIGMQLVPGQTYPMHIFHAERNPIQSNFRIETSIACFSTIIV